MLILLFKVIFEYVEIFDMVFKNVLWFYVIGFFVFDMVCFYFDNMVFWIGCKICICVCVIIIGEIYVKVL